VSLPRVESVSRTAYPRTALIVLGVLGLASVVVAEWASLRIYTFIDRNNVLGLVAHDALPPAVYIASGLLAIVVRPTSRIGLWLWLAGVLTFVGNYGNTMLPGVSQLAIGLQDIYLVPIGVVILTYPSGIFRDRWEKFLAYVGVAQIVVAGLLVTAYLDPARCDPGLCPDNPFLLIRDPAAADAIHAASQVSSILLWLIFAAFVVRRFVRGTPTSRRLLAPVWIAGLLIAASGIASVSIASLAGAEAGSAYDQWVNWGVSIILPVVFLVGLLRQRLGRAAIAGFVEEVAAGVSIGGLRTAFARLAGDPSLVLAFPMDGGGYVDTSGVPVRLPAPKEARTVTPIDRDGRTVAVVVHDAALETDPALVRAAGAAAGLALDNERLTAEVRARLEAVRTSRARLVEAADAERVRIERMLHDGAQQRLVALAIRLRTLGASAGDDAVRARLATLGAELDDALAELRELARGIHPAVLVQAGLRSALASLAQRSEVPVTVDVPERRFPAAVESTAYYVAAEALTNAARHADASMVTVSAEADDDVLHLSIRDDGIGGADPSRGSGLAGLEDRVAAVSGALSVADAPGGGTVVSVSLPLRGARDA
jgi:signal transduction histidine kinase